MDTFSRYLREHGVRYVLVHPSISIQHGDRPYRPDDEAARPYLALAEYLESVLEPVERRVTEEGIILFRLFWWRPIMTVNSSDGHSKITCWPT